MEQIILVTDNPRDYNNFIEILRNKYSVDTMGYISTARYKLLKYPEEYNLIIIEIRIVTHGEFSLKETKDGTITGIVWFEKELAQLGIPVIFWSYDKENKKLIDELKIKYPKNKIGFTQRDNFEEDHLLSGVEKFLNLKK
jgi:Na+-transporting NADH:ubiquinone oxidoreductase subunit NqrF